MPAAMTTAGADDATHSQRCCVCDRQSEPPRVLVLLTILFTGRLNGECCIIGISGNEKRTSCSCGVRPPPPPPHEQYLHRLSAVGAVRQGRQAAGVALVHR